MSDDALDRFIESTELSTELFERVDDRASLVILLGLWAVPFVWLIAALLCVYLT